MHALVTLCTDRELRHYSYECKATAQERPYASRPSRTQQLVNPKLVPKLTSDTPNDLLRKTGIADELLAKKEKSGHAFDEAAVYPRKRSRSESSYSSASVSTISTNLSGLRSPSRSRDHDERAYLTSQDARYMSPHDKYYKRKRSPSSSMSYSSQSSFERRKPRRKDDDRNTRRRRSAASPIARGRNREHDGRRGSGYRRSHSRDRDRNRVARSRQSMSPGPSHVQGDLTSRRNGGQAYSINGDHSQGSFADRGRGGRDRADGGTKPSTARRGRSLSPFSKRLALTQAMNMGN
ncbi:hypothetical protein MMC20_006461 [Loxospora ochrophaea]|nr:hypothetical protein [Loxospora ochrophaea]